MNRVCLVGRLTRDPELRMTPGKGTPVASYTIAVDRDRKNAKGERETDFVECVSWGKLAEIVAQYGKKGRLIALEGRLQIRSYETQEGQKRKVAEVIADNVKFLDKGKGESGQQPDTSANDPNDLANMDLGDLPF